jgi:hypothetical protein
VQVLGVHPLPTAPPADGPSCGDRALSFWPQNRGQAAVLIALAGVFVALNLAFLAPGPRVVGDAVMYVTSADKLVRGEPLPEFAWTRAGYVALVAVCRQAGLGLWGVVVVQLVAAVAAAVALRDLGARLGGAWAGVLAPGVTLANPDIVRWHSHVLTESLYTSAVVLAVWSVLSAVERGRYGLAVLSVAAAATLRPNGWLLAVIAPCYWIAVGVPDWRARLAGLVAVPAVFVAAAFVVFTARPGLLTDAPDVMFRRGEVVWGYPPWRLAMPEDPEPRASGLPGAAEYALLHPLACARLATVRVLAELAHVRPFYSWWHNAAILVTLLPLDGLALVGAIATLQRPAARLLLAVIAAHLAVQAVSFADWDGRFLLYFLPLIGVFAARGAVDGAARWVGGDRPLPAT